MTDYNLVRYAPGRPSTIKDLETVLSGEPIFLGVIVSTGTAINNATTATPFNAPGFGSVAVGTATLAGKVLLIQPTAAGHVLASSSASMLAPVTIVATQATVPPAAGTAPGPKLQAEERVPFVMATDKGYLQFIPTSGSANLFVWELR